MNVNATIYGCIVFFMAIIFWSARYYYQQSTKWKEEAIEASASIKRYEVQLKALENQQRKIAELDKNYTEKLNEAEQEAAALRTQLASGHRRMLVSGQATCSDQTSSAPRSLGHDGAVELSTDTGQHILSVREGIIRDQQKLRYLQHYIRQFYVRE